MKATKQEQELIKTILDAYEELLGNDEFSSFNEAVLPRLRAYVLEKRKEALRKCVEVQVYGSPKSERYYWIVLSKKSNNLRAGGYLKQLDVSTAAYDKLIDELAEDDPEQSSEKWWEE